MRTTVDIKDLMSANGSTEELIDAILGNQYDTNDMKLATTNNSSMSFLVPDERRNTIIALCNTITHEGKPLSYSDFINFAIDYFVVKHGFDMLPKRPTVGGYREITVTGRVRREIIDKNHPSMLRRIHAWLAKSVNMSPMLNGQFIGIYSTNAPVLTNYPISQDKLESILRKHDDEFIHIVRYPEQLSQRIKWTLLDANETVVIYSSNFRKVEYYAYRIKDQWYELPIQVTVSRKS
jgi:hypothetical protein